MQRNTRLIAPQDHGGINLGEIQDMGIDHHALIDFSVNINPFGCSPQVKEALSHLEPSRYPDRHSLELCSRLAGLNNVDPENILPGNGSAELIWLLAHCYLNGRKILILTPTFGEYERAARAVGADIHFLAAQPADFTRSASLLIQACERIKPDVVIFCNPNNPTGAWFSAEEIEEIQYSLPDILFIVDEAYRAFRTLNPFAPLPKGKIILLRSMTKDFALAGLRLGYMIAGRQIIQEVSAIQPPWSISNAAQEAGVASLHDMPFVLDTLAKTQRLAQNFQRSLAAAGAKVIASPMNYFLVDVSPQRGSEIRHRLLTQQIHVRDCASFNLPNFIRIGTRLSEQNQCLLESGFWE